jgi:hypothetical protein
MGLCFVPVLGLLVVASLGGVVVVVGLLCDLFIGGGVFGLLLFGLLVGGGRVAEGFSEGGGREDGED